jgi:hypothetical protein
MMVSVNPVFHVYFVILLVLVGWILIEVRRMRLSMHGATDKK